MEGMIYPGALGRYNRSAKLVGSIHDVYSVQDVIIKPGDDADILSDGYSVKPNLESSTTNLL